MNKLIVFCVIILKIFNLNAQSYYVINFTGTGANPETVLVENLSTGTSVNMQGSDVLHLALVASLPQIITENNLLNIYPNPMDHSCYFEFNNAQQGSVSIRLFTIDGKQLYALSRELSQGNQSFMISGLAAGAYILNVRTQDYNYSGRIISIGNRKSTFSLLHTNENLQPKADNIAIKESNANIIKTKCKDTEAIVNMDYTVGDQLRFIGSIAGAENDTVYASPTGNQLITFNIITTPSISVEDTLVKQYQLVPLVCKWITLTDSIYYGSFNNQSIKLYLVTDTLLAMMIPETGAGNFNFSVNIEGYDFTTIFNVDSLPIITDPIQYYNSFMSQFNFPVSDPMFDLINDSIVSQTAAFNNLSFAEKLVAAYVIDANKDILYDVNSVLLDHFAKTNCDQYSWVPYIKCKMADLGYCVAKLTAIVSGTALVLSAPTFGLTAPAGSVVGLGIVLLTQKGTLRKIGKLAKDIALFPFHTIDANINLQKSNIFYNNISSSIDFKILARNVQNTTYNHAWLSSYVSMFNKLIFVWNFLFDDSIGYEPVIEQQMNIDDTSHVSLIIITNNQNVSGVISGTVNDLKIKFSTLQASSQNFSFVIVFDDGYFSATSDTIHATLSQPSLVGTWEQYSGQRFGSTSYINLGVWGPSTIVVDSVPETMGLHYVYFTHYFDNYPSCILNCFWTIDQIEYTLVLNANGTYTTTDIRYSTNFSYNPSDCYCNYNPMGGPYTSIVSGSWSFNGNTITLTPTNPSYQVEVYNINALSGTQLEIATGLFLRRFNKQ